MVLWKVQYAQFTCLTGSRESSETPALFGSTKLLRAQDHFLSVPRPLPSPTAAYKPTRNTYVVLALHVFIPDPFILLSVYLPSAILYYPRHSINYSPPFNNFYLLKVILCMAALFFPIFEIKFRYLKNKNNRVACFHYQKMLCSFFIVYFCYAIREL